MRRKTQKVYKHRIDVNQHKRLESLEIFLLVFVQILSIRGESRRYLFTPPSIFFSLRRPFLKMKSVTFCTQIFQTYFKKSAGTSSDLVQLSPSVSQAVSQSSRDEGAILVRAEIKLHSWISIFYSLVPDFTTLEACCKFT